MNEKLLVPVVFIMNTNPCQLRVKSLPSLENSDGIFIGGTDGTLGGYAISVGSAEKFVVDATGALTA